jgi:TetR/AcrR family transcriptional regulator, cholesterol catabolism regulator
MASARASKRSASVSDLPLRGSGARKPLNDAAVRREREILNAAMDLFHERGYANTSVEDVASAVGILKGSLYHYIDSKEDLLYRIVEQVHESVQQIMASIEERHDLTPLQRLEAYVREQVIYNAANLRRISVYYQDRARLSPARSAEIRRWRRNQERAVIGLIEQAAAAGEVPADIDTRLAANCVFAVVIWMYTWYRPGGPTSARALAEFSARFVLEGLTGGQPRPGVPAVAAEA